MLKEFKEFATRGNIIDMAIGIIIGGAFQKIVNSLVNDIIMPFISVLIGKVDYTDWVIQIGVSSIHIGTFLTNIINFIIMALSVFLFVKYINKLNKKLEQVAEKEFDKLNKKIGTHKFFKNRKKKKKEEKKPEPTTKICQYCLSTINIKASRCSYCTSIIEDKKEEEILENQIKIEN